MPAGYPKLATRLTDVRYGDLWGVGQHRFVCGDAEDGVEMHRLTDGEHIDLVYSDPPWNNGDAKSWRTQSKRDGAVGRNVVATDVVPKILSVAQARGLLAYVESGLPTLDGFITMLRAMDATIVGQWETWTTVNKKRKNALIAADFGQHTVRLPDFTGMGDGVTPGYAMRAWGHTGTVLDPCSGLGFTSRNAAESGWRSLNHELNPNRMARAMESLEDLTGQTAQLIERTA